MNNSLNAPWTKEPQVGKGAWIKDCNGDYVALSCGSTHEEAEINAILIEALPDLLQACIDFCTKVEEGKARSTHSYNQMKKAINKALSNT